MYILVIWTVIGFSVTSHGGTYEKMGWRPIGEFNTELSCQAAGEQLVSNPKNIRCLKK